MGTHAAIIVEGMELVKVYKHFDGDPDSTLPWLQDFNNKFNNERGEDPHYKFAQLLRSSIRDFNQYDLDAGEFTGWGVMPNNHDSGEDFTYFVLLDGTVRWAEGYKESLKSVKGGGQATEYDPVF
jgi:hypothetical protein